MRNYIDILNDYQIQDEIEEGWKATLGAAALGTAGLMATGGADALVPQHHDSSGQLELAQQVQYSAKAERLARQKGFDSAAAMVGWMKQHGSAHKEEVSRFELALRDIGTDVMALHPATGLNNTAGKIDRALNN